MEGVYIGVRPPVSCAVVALWWSVCSSQSPGGVPSRFVMGAGCVSSGRGASNWRGLFGDGSLLGAAHDDSIEEGQRAGAPLGKATASNFRSRRGEGGTERRETEGEKGWFLPHLAASGMEGNLEGARRKSHAFSSCQLPS